MLPALLDALSKQELAATFFVEGLNAEIYPNALTAIVAAGHEVAYHAWRHEQWGDLTAAAQAANLERGLTAFRSLGLTLCGMRPPGGGLGAGGAAVLREAGLHYCSPAGEGAGVESDIALVPFQWRHVDASCVLPALTSVREQMAGSPDPLDPDAFLAHLEREIERLSSKGGFATIVLHLSMLDWLGEERLTALLELLHRVEQDGDLQITPCREVAEHVLSHPEAFRDGTTLDSLTWGAAES